MSKHEQTVEALQATEFIGMGPVVKALATGLVARQRAMLLVGAPGQAKTALVSELFKKLDPTGEDTCFLSGYRGAGEEQVVGFPNPAAMMNREAFELLPGPSLLNRVWTFFDEIDKVLAMTEHTLLQPLQSKRWSRAGIDLVLKLDTLIAAGNAPPKEEPVRDRFGIQVPVELTPAGQEVLVQQTYDGNKFDGTVVVEAGALESLRAEADAVTASPGVRAMTLQVAKVLDMSPRRIRQNFIPVIKARAAMAGRSEVQAPEDIVEAAWMTGAWKGDLTNKRLAEIELLAAEQTNKALEQDRQAAANKKYKKIRAKIDSLEGASTLVLMRQYAVVLNMAIETAPLTGMSDTDKKTHVDHWNSKLQAVIKKMLSKEVEI